MWIIFRSAGIRDTFDRKQHNVTAARNGGVGHGERQCPTA
jgi:hypothetical protein